MRSLFLLVGCLWFLPAFAAANDRSLPWQQFQAVGQAELNFLFWAVYEASLFSASGEFAFPGEQAFALALEYKRGFSRQDLVTETRRQWQDIGIDVHDRWLEQLAAVLVDVSKGDVITLFVDQDCQSHFFHNNQLLGVIEDPVFTRQFAAIWLSEQTTRPAMRASLLGSAQ